MAVLFEELQKRLPDLAGRHAFPFVVVPTDPKHCNIWERRFDAKHQRGTAVAASRRRLYPSIEGIMAASRTMGDGLSRSYDRTETD
jgi:hypothetical protein